jgi:hypothetical protein
MFHKINFWQQKKSETPYFFNIVKGNSHYIKTQQLGILDSYRSQYKWQCFYFLLSKISSVVDRVFL